MKQNIICLIAPTASGKTALAYELYATGRYHLISVDSALIYRDMNIGTAKPTADELARYPHALVDIINPDQTYSVAQFVKDAQREIDIAYTQGKNPLLVGGTMMYFMALLKGMNDIPATEPTIREQVSQMIESDGITKVHQLLREYDPVLANKLKPNDSQRIGRAMEVVLQTGKPLSEWQQQPNLALANNPNQHWHVFAIMPDRAWLHQRIELRLQLMWEQGFLQEVIDLKAKYDLHPDMPSMRCVGYRQAWEYLEFIEKMPKNRADLYQQMQAKALFATRQLAKRQYTWLKKLATTDNLSYHTHPFTDVVSVRKFLLQ